VWEDVRDKVRIRLSTENEDMKGSKQGGHTYWHIGHKQQ
jgi:hypothetical protein